MVGPFSYCGVLLPGYLTFDACTCSNRFNICLRNSEILVKEQNARSNSNIDETISDYRRKYKVNDQLIHFKDGSAWQGDGSGNEGWQPNDTVTGSPCVGKST